MANEQNAASRFGPPGGALDSSKGVALYVQLADLFRYHILSGAWPGGLRLDNLEVLAARYQVARITVRQAVARLVAEGLLTAHRGRGTFVQQRDTTQEGGGSRRSGDHGTWPEGLKIQIVYKHRSAELPAEFRGDFEVFDGYMEVTKIHVVRDTPFAMVRLYVADEVYKRFPRGAIEKSKLLRLTFANGGAAASMMRQRMTVEPADVLIARHLDCPVGSPVAKILRQIHGKDRRLAYSAMSWYRGESFEMDITLPRNLLEESSSSLIAPKVRGSAR